MKKSNLDLPKLTKNDQEVLKNIIQHAKIPDSEIAKKMKLSPQAVFKIRKKLEVSGIIKGYMPIIDFKKLGINVMLIAVLKLTADVWDKFDDEDISNRMTKVPYIIEAYRLPESDATHILLMGFRNIQQKDRYLIKLQTEFAREVEIKHVYPFSIDRVITRSPVGLLYEMLDKKEFPMDVFFLPRKKKK
ncbi:winged helix-turn-helix transcriptional regulator [archaeon]|jgi:DNA-binding Lrp family transcriptional regulator|nr:winged helix-turn-helix transcriptional regulator [archaeon]MBT4648326.1 winged helix-turn-helix transcriptional regulator [archaeon]MBT6822315.1 winged helix-turn-helix transcriptional regulator [archaeon]MBT7391790.1 winged helix-turn-helix transcriptional regulator [archaeon]